MATIDEVLKHLYSDLQRAYDLTLDRRKTLASQAVSLLSFAGIIQTITIGLVVALATSKDARAVLTASPDYHVFLVTLVIGFISYITTLILAILAFRARLWTPVPQLPPLPNQQDPLKLLNNFFDNPNIYDLRVFANQLGEATIRHEATNRQMYNYLQASTISLVVGIILSTISGFLILVMV